MTAEARDAVSPRLRPPRDAARTPLRGDQLLASRLSAGLTLHCDWPAPTALVLGDPPASALAAALDRHGVAQVAGATSLLQPIAVWGPVTLVIVASSTLRYDTGMREVATAHEMFPYARFLLAHRRDDSDVGLISRALAVGMHDVLDPEDASETEEVVLSELTVAGQAQARVLAVGAHLDDVEIGCGGTLLQHRTRGDRVSILTFSRGDDETDRLAREVATSVTARSLGAQLLSGALPGAGSDDGGAATRLIEEVVELVSPTVAYVHSGHDRHSDHRAVSAASIEATRDVPRVLAFPSPGATQDFRPTRFASIDAVIQGKIEVLLMVGSQNRRSYLEPEMIVAGSRYWARHLGAGAGEGGFAMDCAEPFEVVHSNLGADTASEPAMLTDRSSHPPDGAAPTSRTTAITSAT